MLRSWIPTLFVCALLPVQCLADQVRIATFNVSLYGSGEGILAKRLSGPGDAQANRIAEIIQRVQPEIILLNEFDFEPSGKLVADFQRNYLAIAQDNCNSPEGTAKPIEYAHVFQAPSNTGINSGHDLDRNGQAVTAIGSSEYGGDCWGYGEYPGKYAMVLLSQFPIDRENARTFQRFLWRDMPGALLPDNPDTSQPADWYADAALQEFRLSSKSHWDIPVRIGGKTLHLLASHPTPPTYDGVEDRNGRRNHDEIRFWIDYITPGAGNYIYDDNGQHGGLSTGEPFVVLGDLNGDPADGEGKEAISRLLDCSEVSSTSPPASPGAAQQAELQGGVNRSHHGDPSWDTLDAPDQDGPGNLRVDYVIPARRVRTLASGVFWPKNDDWRFKLVGTFPFPSSDHRLVWRDLELEPDASNE